jgi:hypothetical protein
MRLWTLSLMSAFLITAPDREETELYFFFSPEAPGAKTSRSIANYLQKEPTCRFRPCLLVEDFEKPVSLGSDFLETVISVTGWVPSIAIFDADGLDLAKKFSIRRLPAVVVVRNRKIHITYGADLSLQEIALCWE